VCVTHQGSHGHSICFDEAPRVFVEGVVSCSFSRELLRPHRREWRSLLDIPLSKAGSGRALTDAEPRRSPRQRLKLSYPGTENSIRSKPFPKGFPLRHPVFKTVFDNPFARDDFSCLLERVMKRVILWHRSEICFGISLISQSIWDANTYERASAPRMHCCF
jgi:hypothetical protein